MQYCKIEQVQKKLYFYFQNDIRALGENKSIVFNVTSDDFYDSAIKYATQVQVSLKKSLRTNENKI